MKTDYFRKLTQALAAITRGDYRQGAELEKILGEKSYPAEVLSFTEKLNLMTVKLEAREEALNDNIARVRKQNQALEEGIFKLKLLTNVSFVFFAAGGGLYIYHWCDTLFSIR